MRLSRSHKLKRDSSEKTTWCQSACQALCLCRRWFAVRGILSKGTLARNPWCSRHQRTDEADISEPVAVDQCAANCLKEAARSFTAMRSRCRSPRADVTFRRPLPVFRVVWGSSVYCFQSRITLELFRYTRAPIAPKENPPSRRLIITPSPIQTP
ncbi:uncharacterized protein TNCV_4103121 [Trichonephila clavipes]|nr:uncharacterized protein TNCV_4103121 [Trichonephila clavipes]